MRLWSRSKPKRRDEPAPPAPVSTEPAPLDEDDAPISPLEQRLSTMDWPKPPPGVRERLFEEIVGRADGNGAAPEAPEDRDSRGSAEGR